MKSIRSVVRKKRFAFVYSVFWEALTIIYVLDLVWLLSLWLFGFVFDVGLDEEVGEEGEISETAEHLDAHGHWVENAVSSGH